MGFGFKYQTSGEDFAKVARYDARSGRLFRDDKSADGIKTPTDITMRFKAVADFEQLEVGWMMFAAGTAPDFRMVPIGQDPGARPSDNHKMGVRFNVKLHSDCGGDVREIATSAAAAIAGFEAVYDAFKEQAKTQPAGMLPVIAFDPENPSTPIQSKQSTNYRPNFVIVGWAKRPQDLPVKGKSASSNVVPMGPAATGSTQVPPPAPVNFSSDFG